MPKIKHKHGYSKIIKSDLNNVIDPLTAVKQILKKGYKKCNFKSKVFDGEEVYILTLIDNKIIVNDNEIDNLFDKVISINKDSELKNLVIFKK